VYLQGIHFKIITDCNSLKLILDRKDLNPRISKWVLWLQNYDYKSKHRASSRMKHVDALSRQPVMILEATSFEQNLSLTQLEDSEISKLRDFLEGQEHNKYELRDGLCYERGSSSPGRSARGGEAPRGAKRHGTMEPTRGHRASRSDDGDELERSDEGWLDDGASAGTPC
jgi:hypothetical protein